MKCNISFVTRSDEDCNSDCVWWNKEENKPCNYVRNKDVNP